MTQMLGQPYSEMPLGNGYVRVRWIRTEFRGSTLSGLHIEEPETFYDAEFGPDNVLRQWRPVDKSVPLSSSVLFGNAQPAPAESGQPSGGGGGGSTPRNVAPAPAPNAGTAFSAGKVGSVDLQRAINECAEGRAAKARFEQLVEDFKSKLKAEKDEIDALKANGTDQQQLQAKMQQFKQDYEAAQNALKSMDTALTGNVVKSLRETITRLAQRDHFTSIVETSQRSNTVYGPPPVDNAVDVTDEVIRLHDEEALRTRETASPSKAGTTAGGKVAPLPDTPNAPAAGDADGKGERIPSASTFVPMPADISCTLKQVGVQMGSGPLVRLTCAMAGRAHKDIYLASDVLTGDTLSTQEFGDFHIANFAGVDIRTALTSGAPYMTSESRLSITLHSDKLKSFREYLQ